MSDYLSDFFSARILPAMGMPPATVTRDQGGRIVGTVGLTEKRKAFVRAYVANGANASQAAKTAGYERGEQEGWRLLREPAVLDAIHAEQARVIGAEGASLAVGFLVKLIRDEEAPPKLRLDASKTMLDRAGHIAPKALEAIDPTNKDPKDMTMQELMETADKIRSEIQQAMDKAKDITPIIAHDGAQTGDIIDANPLNDNESESP